MLAAPYPPSDLPSSNTAFVKRPGFGTKGRPTIVYANFFEVKDLPRAKIFQYDVSISPESAKSTPDLNRKIFSRLLDQYLSSDMQTIRPVYDGRANMFTAREFPFAQKTFDVHLPPFTSLTGQTPHDGQKTVPSGTAAAKPPSVYKVKLNRVAVIDMSELQKFMQGKTNITSNVRQGIMSLDILIRHEPSFLYTSFGRSFFISNKSAPLAGGLEVWQGYYQSVRPCIGRMYVNVDVSATAFYQGGALIDVAMKFLKMRSRNDFARPINPQMSKKLERFLKGLKFTVIHRPGSKKEHRIVALSQKSSKDTRFKSGDGQISVLDYFARQYNRRIQYPALPCVIAKGPNNSDTLYPMEVCNIVPGQRYRRKLNEDQTRDMLSFTCKHPTERQKAIQEGLQILNYDGNSFMKDFGMKVARTMAQINARILSPPTITYGNKKTLDPTGGAWNLRGIKLADGKTLESWGVAVMDLESRCPRPSVQDFIREMIIVSEATGLTITNKKPLIVYLNPHGNLENDFTSMWKNVGNAAKKRPQLLVCLLAGKGVPLYAEIKRIGETVLGVCTQCMQTSHIRRRDLKMYFANVALKINAKLGGYNSFLGVNQVPLLWDKATLIVGADVSHPPPGDTVRPSIAAVVGSLDRFASRHGASICVQDHRTERLYDLKEMMKERLKAYFTATKYKPEQILFYRDGVSEGEFAQVMEIEVKAIRAACEDLTKNYRPKITFIIVQKRHHARFFPIKDADKSGNCPSGMVIDSQITHPKEYDFYLQSHAGLLGTSRSTHYHVLLDEIQIGADALQQLTYNLCHVYGRCTRTVSLVPAVYYAHLVAARARYYCKGETWTDSSETSSSQDVSAAGYGTVKSELNHTMWFM